MKLYKQKIQKSIFTKKSLFINFINLKKNIIYTMIYYELLIEYYKNKQFIDY